MADLEQLTLALAPDLLEELRAAVHDGEFNTLDEAVSAAVEVWRNAAPVEPPDLRRLVQDGTDSGPSLDADTVFAALRTRLRPDPKGS